MPQCGQAELCKDRGRPIYRKATPRRSTDPWGRAGAGPAALGLRRCAVGAAGADDVAVGAVAVARFSPRLPAGGVFPAAGAVVREAGAVAVGEEEVDAGAPLVELDPLFMEGES